MLTCTSCDQMCLKEQNISETGQSCCKCGL